MRKTIIIGLILICPIALGISLFSRPAKAYRMVGADKTLGQATNSTPRKIALLVGVSKYNKSPKPEDKPWPPLSTEEDIRLLKETLIRKFGFAEKDIRILNTPATQLAQVIKAKSEKAEQPA